MQLWVEVSCQFACGPSGKHAWVLKTVGSYLTMSMPVAAGQSLRKYRSVFAGFSVTVGVVVDALVDVLLGDVVVGIEVELWP